MKKQYIQPMMTVETIETELPISTSARMAVDNNPDNSIDEDEFLSKDRNIFGLDNCYDRF